MEVANRTADTKPQSNASAPGKVEEITKPVSAVTKSDDGLTGRAGQLVPGAKGGEEAPSGRSRVGSGNAGQGYTFEEVYFCCVLHRCVFKYVLILKFT